MAAPAWDYQHPYQGKPGVPVPGFPRPLYPPNVPKNSGHKPSPDGPDVIAYKRTISRLGRWPWQPFDDTMSNAFSHGKAGGNVGDSGVAGFQRQQNIKDSGWIGEKTFGALRCALVPDGLPHAGEYGMDANAQNLVAEAWQMYAGNPDDSGQGALGETIRGAALDHATGEVGYTEGANNNTPYGSWYGVNHQPWCAIFVTWAYLTNPVGYSPSFVRGVRYAYVPYIVADATNRKYGLSVTTSPIPGDLVCYDWDGQDYDHVGLFQSGTASSWTAIEGNTSPDSGGSQSNGGGVYRRQRAGSQAHRVAFIRVSEP